MSSSVFKDYPSERSDDGDPETLESNLVVFINKNGSVSVDQSALQDLLVNDATKTNTSVSVIRVGSPTPSLELELNEQDELESAFTKSAPGSEDEWESDGSQHEKDDEEDAEQEDGLEDDDPAKKRQPPRKRKGALQEKVPNVSLMVENYFNPAEAKQLANEILNLAGITNPLQMSVDFEFVRYVIGNDHCYSLHQRNPSNDTDDSLVHSEPKVPGNPSERPTPDKSRGKRKTTNVPMDDTLDATEEEGEAEQNSNEEEDYTDSDQTYVSPSESDRDSDLDFSVNDRNARVRKLNKSRPPAKVRPLKRAIIPKKQHIVTVDPPAEDDSAKKKTYKPAKKVQTARAVETIESSPVSKAIVPAPTGPITSTPTTQAEANTQRSTIPKIVSVTINPKTLNRINVYPRKLSKTVLIPNEPPISTDPLNKTNVVKTVKKTNVPTEALFSDMNSLFSTPDIIKKVPGSQAETPSNNRVTNISVFTLPPVTLTPIPIASTPSISHNALGKTLFMTLAPNQNRQRFIHGQNTTTIRPNSAPMIINSSHPNMVFNNVLHRQPPHQATAMVNNTRTVVTVLGKPSTSVLQMTNHNLNTSMTHQQTLNTPMTNQSLNTPMSNTGMPTISTVSNINHSMQMPISNMNMMPIIPSLITNDTPVLTDADLLEELGHVEDTLSEDLMQHVAKLAEDKNLQEVIDQQVLGVDPKVLNHSMVPLLTNIAPIIPIISTPTMSHKPTKMPAPKLPVTPTTPSTPAKPRPVPIQIVRSDGRVITLPPIEAPTTRGAKRRAQNQNPNDSAASPAPATPPAKPEVTSETVLSRRPSLVPDRRSSSVRKSVSAKPNPIATSTGQSTIEIIDLDDDLEEDGSDGSYNSEDDPFRIWCICRQPHNNRFMICCDKCEDWFHGKCVSVTKAMGVELEQRGVEWVCPNCIKKHPHLQQRQLAVLSKKIPSRKSSNSSLVHELSATASILDTSLQSCIVCKKAARPNSIYCSDDCIRISSQSTKSVASLGTPHHTASPTSVTAKTMTSTAVTNSSLSAIPAIPPQQLTSTPKTTQTTIKRTANIEVSIPTSGPKTSSAQNAAKITITNQPNVRKGNHVDVFEPSTGRCLVGSSAPTTENLKKWLQDHPTFEVVQPGSASSVAFKAKKQQLQQLAKTMAQEEHNKLFSVSPQQQKLQTTLKIGPSKKIFIVNPQTQATIQLHSPQSAPNKPVAHIKNLQKVSSPTLSAGTPKQPQASGSKPGSSVSSSKAATAQPIKRKPDDQSPAASVRSNVTTEPIRVNVRRTLKEQLTLRMDEQTDAEFPKLNDEEIETFVENTENEIYSLFNKDTGMKYRAKYRSLMFNVKDRKNTSLFLKICDKRITPYQLVRMSAEELASQELAQWRENENKHQLEMIKKSELELLASAKTYVLKTHKGEEVIGGSISDRVSLDPMVSLDDVVSVLNNTSVTSTSDNTDAKQSPAKDNRIDSRFERYHSADNSSATKTSSSSKPTKSPTRESNHSHSRTNRSSSSSKHRKRSRDHKSPSDSDRSKNKVKHESSRIESSSDNRDKYKSSKSSSSDKSRDKDKKRLSDRKRDEHKKRSSESRASDEPKNAKPTVQNYNIIDEILKAQMSSISKTEDSVETVPEKKSEVPIPSTHTSTDNHQEPSSTVITPTPPENQYHLSDSPIEIDDDSSDHGPFWSGSLFMLDVATLDVSMTPITGDSTNVDTEIPDELNVVGRISPDTVWDYISKIRKSVNKDILVVRFRSSSDTQDNIDAYDLLYRYLADRKRFGVIQIKSAYIKDFYMIPLAAHKSMPSILPPPGKEFDVNRDDMLIGIIVLNINIAQPLNKKRPALMPAISNAPKMSRISESLKTSVTNMMEEQRYITSSVPKGFDSGPSFLKAKSMGNPLNTVMDDGDEPYSPGGSDDDDSIMPYSTLSAHPANPLMHSLASSVMNSRDQPSPTATLDQITIQRKMEEITRQIEVQKKEIIGMLHDDPRGAVHLDEPYSPTSMLGADKQSDGLSGIAIPANLKEILNSIKGTTNIPTNAYANEEYDPTAVVPSASALSYQPMSVGYVPAAKDSAPSKLAQLTDEELLSMVPDDAREHLAMPAMAPPSDIRSMYHLQSALHPPGVDEEYVP